METLPCDRSNGSFRAKDRRRAGSPGAFCVVDGGGGGDELGNDSVRRMAEESPLSNDVTGIVVVFLRGEVRGRVKSDSFGELLVISTLVGEGSVRSLLPGACSLGGRGGAIMGAVVERRGGSRGGHVSDNGKASFITEMEISFPKR